jgi:hypothetical protein
VVPALSWKDLRELTRYRKTPVQERADEVNRLHKTLEGANTKLAAVATDVLGVSLRAMFAALLTLNGIQTSWLTSRVARSARNKHKLIGRRPVQHQQEVTGVERRCSNAASGRLASGRRAWCAFRAGAVMDYRVYARTRRASDGWPRLGSSF